MPRRPKTKVRTFKGVSETNPRYEYFKNKVGLTFVRNSKGRYGEEITWFLGKGRVRIDNRTGSLFRPLKITRLRKKRSD